LVKEQNRTKKKIDLKIFFNFILTMDFTIEDNINKTTDTKIYKYSLGYALNGENYKTNAGFDRYDDMLVFIQTLNQENLRYSIWDYKGERVEIFPKIDYSKIRHKDLCYWCIEMCYEEEIITIPELKEENGNTFCKTCCKTEECKEFLSDL
tara:strand:- start:86 stop:538 length:453 start_codon:yes stop_codon:yes gene_type:complete